MPGKDVQVYSIVCGSGSVRGEGGGLVLLLLIWGALDCDDSKIYLLIWSFVSIDIKYDTNHAVLKQK